MDIRSDMLSRLKNRKPGFSLDQPFYIDADYFQQDLAEIWYKDWLFIAHDCELPKPGNFLTVQVGAYPVIIVRDNDGGIRAFHNSCRHRGSRVVGRTGGALFRAGHILWTLDRRRGSLRIRGRPCEWRPSPRAASSAVHPRECDDRP